MGAGQSADTKLRGDGKLRDAARRAFFKEHGRDPTEEEEHKFQVAYDRDDPTDAHLGAVTAEEADVQRDTASELLQAAGDSEPTDEMLSTFTEKLARAFRRAALEAVEPDIEAVRRELVRRAVDAEKASSEVVPFGPPPRPADESAAESPFERAARLEHERRSGSSRPRPMLYGRRRRPIARKSKIASTRISIVLETRRRGISRSKRQVNI